MARGFDLSFVKKPARSPFFIRKIGVAFVFSKHRPILLLSAALNRFARIKTRKGAKF
jgi:hypothetical protein